MEDRDPIRVFISSKQSEFPAERSALASTINGMPLLAPVIAENWAPERLDVRQRFLRDVERSPIYLGLFGRAYSEPTVLEYETAEKNQKRELLIYVKRCDISAREPRMADFIRTLESKYVLSFFDGVADLVGHVERHLWRAVGRMIEAYLALAEPQPVAHANGPSVLHRKWTAERQRLLALGLPGAADPQSAGQWAERLKSVLPPVSP